MRTLLAAAALSEAGFGILAFAVPGLVLVWLFGNTPTATAVIAFRVAAVALIGLGVACYPAGPRQGLYGLLAYGGLATMYLLALGVSGTAGVLLWPAVVVHVSLCACLVVAARANPLARISQ